MTEPCFRTKKMKKKTSIEVRTPLAQFLNPQFITNEAFTLSPKQLLQTQVA